MKYALLLAIALAATGCSRNEIEIRNSTDSEIHFLFLGNEYLIESGRVKNIGDIPNGAFRYTSGVRIIPSWAKSVELGNGLEGTLVFTRDQTRYTLLYAATTVDNIYSIGCYLSSSDAVAPFASGK